MWVGQSYLSWVQAGNKQGRPSQAACPRQAPPQFGRLGDLWRPPRHHHQPHHWLGEKEGHDRIWQWFDDDVDVSSGTTYVEQGKVWCGPIWADDNPARVGWNSRWCLDFAFESTRKSKNTTSATQRQSWILEYLEYSEEEEEGGVEVFVWKLLITIGGFYVFFLLENSILLYNRVNGVSMIGLIIVTIIEPQPLFNQYQ